MTRCAFRGGNDGLETGGITGGGLVVGGRPGMGNTFDLAGTPCKLDYYSDSRSEISYNRMSSQWGEGVMVMQGVGAADRGRPAAPAGAAVLHPRQLDLRGDDRVR